MHAMFSRMAALTATASLLLLAGRTVWLLLAEVV